VELLGGGAVSFVEHNADSISFFGESIGDFPEVVAGADEAVDKDDGGVGVFRSEGAGFCSEDDSSIGVAGKRGIVAVHEFACGEVAAGEDDDECD